MNLIICTRCFIPKPIEDYYKSKTHKQGFMPGCKICRKNDIRNKYNGNYHKDRLANLSPEMKLYRSQQLTERARERRKDPIIKLKESIRTRIYNGLKDGKDRSTEKYLGCNIQEYKLYIESLFTSEMSWDNYGKDKYWEIDHTIPICSFDLSNKEELIRCFHFSNTKPLSIQENREKSGKYLIQK